jgi:hypothetical protein
VQQLDPAVADLIKKTGQDLMLLAARSTKDKAYVIGALAYATALSAVVIGVTYEDLSDLISKYYEGASIAEIEADLDGQVVFVKKPEGSV